ncbi:VPS28 protein-domain-containing protein [Paraphysoderma sedebokerense]|nr:VPS28 protein-domain-containing protein [Paraphysoderma sedebokerense]
MNVNMNRQLPPPPYTPPSNFSSTSSSRSLLDEEIKLYTSSAERSKYENLADLYAIIVSTEALEKAYIRDAISSEEYTPTCTKLIAQFKTALNLLSDSVKDVEQFMREYKLTAPLAVNRLLKIGVPATVEHATNVNTDVNNVGKNAKVVAECVQHFITLQDSLRLNMHAVDQIHPLLSDLIQSLHAIPASLLPSDYQGKEKIKKWLIQLNLRKASDELSEDEVRQLLFDLESAHVEFYRGLKG